MEKPQEEEPEKTNTESEVQSMVMVPIHQDTSLVPLMTTPFIDLTLPQPDSITIHAPLQTSTTTTTTITTTTLPPPPPPHPQQSTKDPILLQCIGELEQHMADLIQNNLALEERKAVDEIVMDVVDWAMQAPLRDRFSDLPTIDMKEILQQWMFKDNSYKAHEVYENLFEALEKSLKRDYSNQLLKDVDEACMKKRKRRNSPRTPSGSPPSQPPPPPPPTSASGAPGTSGASGSSQLPPPPLPLSTAWTTSDTRYESAGVFVAKESYPTDFMMNDDSIPDEQVHLSDDEDTRNDHLPKADIRKDWWKPLPEEERPATPELAWTIPLPMCQMLRTTGLLLWS
ncbi:hypothetical protein Tco_0991242 [Tanacetum coccineum]|uniref:Uncharacterized protein n=1 Tax=Tanacetum coccineum TaxID=301880 RepID=A0ABQ5EYP4_9ASTR